MQIQMNFGKLTSSDALSEHVTREVEDALEHVRERITRVEVHVQDTNAGKGGMDKRVLMEARPAGLDPIAVDEHGADVYLTVKSAAEKLRTALTRRFDKLADTHGG